MPMALGLGIYSIWDMGPTRFAQMMNLGYFFTARPNSIPYEFILENVEMLIFAYNCLSGNHNTCEKC